MRPGNYPMRPGNYAMRPVNYPMRPGNYPMRPGNYPIRPGNYPTARNATSNRTYIFLQVTKQNHIPQSDNFWPLILFYPNGIYILTVPNDHIGSQ